MRSSHCARGKDSAGATYFLNYRACRSILRNPRRYKRLSLRETCRQLVEQAGDSAARRRRNQENVLRAELGMLAAVTTEVIAHLAFCAG